MMLEYCFAINSAFQKLQLQSCLLWGALPLLLLESEYRSVELTLVLVTVILLGLHFGKTYILKIVVI